LDWQVEQGDHQRIVVLFERCLIPCALYEQFSAKYARYLERAHKEGKDRDEMGRVGLDMAEGDVGKARDAFNTGLGVVDQMREARCTWTLRGWRETLKDGTQVMRAEEDLEQGLEDGNGESKDKENAVDSSEAIEESINETSTSALVESEEIQLTESDMVTEGKKENGIEEVNENIEDTVVEDGEVDRLGTLKPGESSSSSAVEAEMSGVVVSDVWQVQGRGWEAVRDVYRRAAIVHCPKKAVIRMKWAQFEENIGNVEQARDILRQLVTKYPMLLEARMQQIDLERREKKWEVAEKMYTKLMKQIPSKHEKYKNMKTWIAMKYARFQFKICGNADKALAALRSALKKERGNAKLYSQIIDICYQRQPIDVTGVTAAIGQQGPH
jgi:tetratricopeptide (TPR) repeat protein